MDIHSRILAACRGLAMENGFRGINMDELARQAGVSKRTVYRYFPSKEAIIIASIDDFMDQMQSETNRILSADRDLASTLTELAETQRYLLVRGQFAFNPKSIRDLQQYYPHLWEKIDLFRSKSLRQIMTRIAGQADPHLFADIDCNIAETLIIAGIQAVINPDFISTHHLSFEDAVRQVSHILLYGLLPR